MGLNKTQLYRKANFLCIECMVPLYASERGVYIRCEKCRRKQVEEKFLKIHGYPMPAKEETPKEKPKKPKQVKVTKFSERVARCEHCVWASYPGKDVLYCLFPYCVNETGAKRAKVEEGEETGA